MPDPIINLLDILVGVVVGALLSQWAWRTQHGRERKEREQDRQREREESGRAVRELIGLEIQHNLERLARLWSEVSVEPPGPSKSEQVSDQRAFSLANAEVPYWTMRMWEANATRLNDALDAREISETLKLYWQLERLSNLQRDVIKADAIALRKSPLLSSFITVTTNGSPQDLQAMQQIEDARAEVEAAASTRMEKYRAFESLILDILERGNPLPAPTNLERTEER